MPGGGGGWGVGVGGVGGGGAVGGAGGGGGAGSGPGLRVLHSSMQLFATPRANRWRLLRRRRRKAEEEEEEAPGGGGSLAGDSGAAGAAGYSNTGAGLRGGSRAWADASLAAQSPCASARTGWRRQPAIGRPPTVTAAGGYGRGAAEGRGRRLLSSLRRVHR